MEPTSAQRQAIDSDAQEIIVVAGPGSGKTATTIRRIKRLVVSGTNPRGIVALTFTNAAAAELEERLSSHNIDGLGYCGTLHGFALRCLKQYGQALGYGERLALIGEEATAAMIESKARSLGCKTPLKKLLQIKPATHLRGILTNPGAEFPRLSPELRVIAAYYADLRESGLVDFDTILSEFSRMAQRPGFELPFTHLFVDEVQDSAAIDWEIYRALPMANKFYVGDPDQSIYAFRGGRPDLMLDACRRPGVEVIALEANFRGHSEICDAANALIEHNQERIHKATLSVRGSGGQVTVFKPALNEGDEISTVVAALISCVEVVPSGRVPEWPVSGDPVCLKHNEIAVLARNNDLCAAYRDQLKVAGIPVAEAERVDLPPDWSLARSLVELLVNPENDTLAYFFWLEKQKHHGLADDDAAGVAHATRQKAARLGLSINRMLWNYGPGRVEDIGAALAAQEVTAESRMRVVQLVRRLPIGSDLLALALAMGQDQGEKTAAVEGVTVTTLHGSKGKEFDVVFLVGFEDEILPGNRKSDGPEQVEEARRLAFVGMTRARNALFISHSLSRKTSWGAVGAHKESRFVKEAGL